MFYPKYRVLISGEYFPLEECICQGTQLISIVNSIKDFLPNHIWSGADVQAVGKNATNHNVNDIQLNILGNDLQFIEYCSGIDQFIWGVFVCIDSNFSSQNIQGVELETEDEAFRSIPCAGVLVEIRAFDTTYFEIYAEDLDLIKKISSLFGVEIKENKII